MEEAESDKDRTINIYYPYVIALPGYLQPRIQLEIGSRSLREPFMLKSISSLVDEAYPNSDFVQDAFKVSTVSPERTFLEKVFLLHEEFQRPAEKMRVNRLSRHLYEIMLEQMIYEENPPSFEELMESLGELNSRINSLNWKFDFDFPIPLKLFSHLE